MAWCFASGDMAIEYFPLGGEPHLRESYTVGQGTGKAQGLHHYRGLHQLRRLCGGLPPAGHHLGRAQRHPPGSTASTAAPAWSIAPWRPLYQGSRRPSLRKLNEGFVWAFGEELSPYLSHLLPCGFSGRSRGILKISKKRARCHTCRHVFILQRTHDHLRRLLRRRLNRALALPPCRRARRPRRDRPARGTPSWQKVKKPPHGLGLGGDGSCGRGPSS